MHQLLQDIYAAAALKSVIDYSQQPTPALTEADFAWVQTLV
ncbi:DUF4058 family protein [Nodosilinea sp. LEGE 06152]|nr:DUF4058 family protein [Nodosilinea sp. LEGE 06152]